MPRWTPDKTATMKAAFLDIFSALPEMELACDKLGVGKSTVYEWAAKDPAFKERVQQCRMGAFGYLMDIAFKRAQKSDTLTIYLMKCMGGEKFSQMEEKLKIEYINSYDKKIEANAKSQGIHPATDVEASDADATPDSDSGR